VGEAEIDAYLQNTSTTRGLPLELAGYGAFMKGTINPMPRNENIWTSKQTYIALLIYCAAAELKLTPHQWKVLMLHNSMKYLD
jgi:hypothetical protein